MRILLVAVAAALLAAFLASLAMGAGPRTVGSAQYVVRPDPRLCPSPRCGGYWVALANRERTRCVEGALRPRCYVARALDENRQPLTSAVPDGALVRGALEPWTLDGFGPLASLVAAEVRAPVGQKSGAPIFRVRDTGIRCVKAPCYFMRAARLSHASFVTISELELDSVGLDPESRRRAEAALRTKNGLFVAGRLGRADDGGRRLRAVRVYLSA